MDNWYDIGAAITGVVTFLGTWAYCSIAYGFLGFALGWIPAAILAWILSIAWPLIAALLVIAGLALFLMLSR